jgi:hypothetical protein
VTLIVETETASLTPDPPRQPAGTSEPAATFPRGHLPSPDLTTADADLGAVLAQSIKDLGVLRIFDPRDPVVRSSPPARPGSWRCSGGIRC